VFVRGRALTQDGKVMDIASDFTLCRSEILTGYTAVAEIKGEGAGSAKPVK